MKCRFPLVGHRRRGFNNSNAVFHKSNIVRLIFTTIHIFSPQKKNTQFSVTIIHNSLFLHCYYLQFFSIHIIISVTFQFFHFTHLFRSYVRSRSTIANCFTLLITFRPCTRLNDYKLHDSLKSNETIPRRVFTS